MATEATASLTPASVGIAVFIDDNQSLLRTEKRIAGQIGFETLEIGVGDGLDEAVAEIFTTAQDLGIPSDKIVFFIDNRMSEFATVLTQPRDSNVIFFNQYRDRMGPHGKHAGMAIAEWLVANHGNTNPGFYLALLSGFSEEGITRRLRILKDLYPHFLGFLTKIGSDADKASSHDERVRKFREAMYLVNAAPAGSPVVSKASTNYPYGKVLLSIIQDLELTSEEICGFLRLSHSALPKTNVLYEDPSKFELDTLDWQEKVFLVWELLLILEHDFEDFEKVKMWLNSPHVLLQGATPRSLIVSGLTSEIDTLRAIVRY
ncbi:hypothetical protein [Bradyrhizobium sp.]|uniref:hypothetical protein n=1 Tax=Bradyrhizobium sp. TaxID=376 RepID=UPI002E03A714|nr:hypothetical protein [Bradyrhizobium sp.]